MITNPICIKDIAKKAEICNELIFSINAEHFSNLYLSDLCNSSSKSKLKSKQTLTNNLSSLLHVLAYSKDMLLAQVRYHVKTILKMRKIYIKALNRKLTEYENLLLNERVEVIKDFLEDQDLHKFFTTMAASDKIKRATHLSENIKKRPFDPVNNKVSNVIEFEFGK